MARLSPLSVSALAALALLALPAEAAAQAGTCELTRNTAVERRTLRGVAVIEIFGPLEFRCGGGVVIRADHGLLDEATRLVELTGSVDYLDPERRLTSQRATYASTTGRLHATGNVVLVDTEGGSTLRGPELEYFRAIPGRPEVLAHAPGRPRLDLQPAPRDDGTPQEPYRVDADHITLRGERHVTATGRVVIHRSDLDATGARGVFDGAREILQLEGNARLEGERFDLAGEAIEAHTPEGVLTYVRARGDARLDGEGTRVRGPTVQLFFAGELLERLVASGRPGSGEVRATVEARGFRMEADSVDARSPAQRLETVYAVGSARGETTDTLGTLPGELPPVRARGAPPSVLAALGESDWILGDTIVGHFEPGGSAVPGEAGEVELRRVVSTGGARSLYRVGDAARPERPSLNYLSGDVIELTLQGGGLERAEVSGLRQGMLLEPREPLPAPPAEPPTPGAVGEGR